MALVVEEKLGTRRRGRVTREDVAKLAGVSVAVVSYVVNDGPRPVADATRERVLRAIDELDYMPSATARALRLGTTSSYGVVVPNVGDSFTSAIVDSIDQEISKHCLSMLLANTHDSPSTALAVVQDMLARGVDGLIIQVSSVRAAGWREQRLSVPTVFIDRQEGMDGFTTVGPDFLTGGKIATQHLINHGYKQILPILGHFILKETNIRYTGYLEACSEAGLEPVEPIYCDWSLEGGYAAGKEFLQKDPMPPAVFCFSDAIAVGFQKALQEAGLSIPEDVAIVGFDGTKSVNFVHPTITTVRQPIPEMIQFSVETLANKNSENRGKHQMFPVSLQLGSSCGC